MKKYLWVPGVLILVGGIAAFFEFSEPNDGAVYGDALTRSWLAVQWYWIALVSGGLMFCVLLVDDVVSYVERWFVRRRYRSR